MLNETSVLYFLNSKAIDLFYEIAKLQVETLSFAKININDAITKFGE